MQTNLSTRLYYAYGGPPALFSITYITYTFLIQTIIFIRLGPNGLLEIEFDMGLEIA